MSHANGQVKFNDGLILHFEYDSTSDVCIPTLKESAQEIRNNWRAQPRTECKCARDEVVEIANDYGNGSWYTNGRACRHCKVITLDPVVAHKYQDAEIVQEFDGLPAWWL